MPHAIRYARYGGPEVLTLDEIPMPEPGPGKVRIEVRAAGVNAFDSKIRRGMFADGTAPSKPARVGIDVAGVIDAVGADVDGWAVGQAVFGQVGSGAAATNVLADPSRLVPRPDWLSFEDAAALPVATEAAHRSLRLLDVAAGETLLVHAVAGGAGLVTAQLARIRGVRVVGTASAERDDALREFGITPVAYGDGWVERVRAAAPDGIDKVLDASGRGVLAGSIELTGDADRVLTIADGSADEYGVRFTSGGGATLPEVFAEVLPLVHGGDVRLPVAEVFPLERAADAYRRSDQAHVLGKIVISVSS